MYIWAQMKIYTKVITLQICLRTLYIKNQKLLWQGERKYWILMINELTWRYPTVGRFHMSWDNTTMSKSKVLGNQPKISVPNNSRSCSTEVTLITSVSHLVVEENGGGVFEKTVSQNLQSLHIPVVSCSCQGKGLNQSCKRDFSERF